MFRRAVYCVLRHLRVVGFGRADVRVEHALRLRELSAQIGRVEHREHLARAHAIALQHAPVLQAAPPAPQAERPVQAQPTAPVAGSAVPVVPARVEPDRAAPRPSGRAVTTAAPRPPPVLPPPIFTVAAPPLTPQPLPPPPAVATPRATPLSHPRLGRHHREPSGSSAPPAAPAAPRLHAPPAAMLQAPSQAASFAPPATPSQQSITLQGDIILDGARVGRWMTSTLARQAARPAAGPTGPDPRQTPLWSGQAQGF